MRWVILALALTGCAASGPNPYSIEMQAYEAMLNEQLQAGKLTLPQAQYLQAQKLNELRSRQAADQANRNAAVLNALGAAAVVQQNTTPVMGPSPLNCTTFQRGPYGQITCQ